MLPDSNNNNNQKKKKKLDNIKNYHFLSPLESYICKATRWIASRGKQTPGKKDETHFFTFGRTQKEEVATINEDKKKTCEILILNAQVRGSIMV